MRIKTEYDAAKKICNEAPKILQVVSDTLGRVESLQTQEVRLLLEQKLGMISERARGLINQVVNMALMNRGMSSEGMDVAHSTQVASGGVSVVQYPDWATDTERVTRTRSLAISNWGTKISVATYKDPFLRKLE